jgi:hypothetical protein
MFISRARKPLKLILMEGIIREMPFHFENCKKSSYLRKKDLTPAPLSKMERGRGRGKNSTYESTEIWWNIGWFP